jgi:hypothetical protein
LADSSSSSSSNSSTNADAAAAALRQLVAAAVPSPFGKGSETVYDPSVRTAAEIKAAQLALNKTLPPPEVGSPCKRPLRGGDGGGGGGGSGSGGGGGGGGEGGTALGCFLDYARTGT